jgi:hypothetical protein
MASAIDDGRMTFEMPCPCPQPHHENVLRSDLAALRIYTDEGIERFLDEDELDQGLAIRVSLWLTP